MNEFNEKQKLKYEYHLLTWGGFYNEEHQKIHKQISGDFWFNSNEDREKYIDELKEIEAKLGAKYLVVLCTEGYNCRVRTKIHRVCEYKGKQYYSEYDMGINYGIDESAYHLEYKWYPGFNDYPLGEQFDYSNPEFKIISQWVSGAFNIEIK